MSSLALAFLLLTASCVLVFPRRWAALPFLAGACYLPTGLSFSLGPFHFYALRVLLAVALLRLLLRWEGLPAPRHGLDCMMLAWAAAALASSFFYVDVGAALVTRLGLVYTGCGAYFIFRVFCRSMDDVTILCRITAMVLVPLALAMFSESRSGFNLFSEFGGVAPMSEVRVGAVRAQGPFAHSILAGSMGAASLPMMILLWNSHRMTSVAGIAACLTIVFSSHSSGPVMSIFFAVLALLMWPMRHRMRLVRWTALLAYLALDLVMKAPAYYLLARIDLTGSSTSWHRAALIDAAIDHWSEWWLAGTAYTRHWMPYGVTWSANHSDITNYYLRMGVEGGLPLMLLFIGVLARGFSLCGQAWREAQGLPPPRAFAAWALGASLFAHAAAFMSVSYFDQSVVFLYLVLAAIGAAPAPAGQRPVLDEGTAGPHRAGRHLDPAVVKAET